ncbi:MAG: hypothetical protein BGN98_13700 [Microbacterium sp. 69-7]|uniref:hypothetical protein n=1 Tax=Microbacterium sp. 69-7 TaxID=1895784 RepID=UPI00095AC200|nr:hypothetical protein [Microbacterium sp. 69-7]OJU44434.1 MAG: hypothetical protein BGN98_13700 [Microbacterium sp. 69-7]
MVTIQLAIPSRIGQIDARVFITRGTSTAESYGIAFDEDGATIAETSANRYSGFCDAEIAYDEAHRLMAWRWGVESEDIAAAVDAAGLTCDCE